MFFWGLAVSFVIKLRFNLERPHPTQSVGVVQLEEVKFSKAEIAALDKILSKTSQFNKNPELFANELKVLDINLENYIL